MKTTDYQRIDCNYYDELEAFAVKNTLVEIEYLKNGEEKMSTKAVLKDFFIENKAEYVLLGTGETIRLDFLIQVGGKHLPRNGESYPMSCKIN